MATVSLSMATKSSDLDDQKTGASIQTEGHTLTPPSSWHGPEETEAFGSAPSHLPSQSPVRNPTPDHPGTWYCLEIQVISAEDGRTTPPPPHAWQVPVVKEMVWDGKSSLTEAVVMGPSQAVLFYGQQFLGKGLSLGEACSHCQEPLVGLANKPISMPAQWAWVKASSWSSNPSPNDTMNPGDLGFLLHSACIITI